MNISLILLLFFTFFYLIHLLYLSFYIFPLNNVISRTSNQSVKPHKTHEKVAVLVAVHNEEENISELVQSLLYQDYPSYEIHIINDYSTDETPQLLKKYSNQHNKLYYHENPLAQGKKFAIRHGIETVNCSILLFTDADCRPASEKWISSMVHALGEKEICLGYGGYTETSGFLNAFIRFETVMIASQYMAFAERQTPYMGVGRNLMYRRKLFMKSDKFSSHQELKSGDDDLFIAQYSSGKNTSINLSPESFTFSEPKKTWIELLKQKRRHLTTSTEYSFPIKLKLGAISLSNIYIYLLAAVISIFYPQYATLLIISIILKWSIDMLAYRKVFRQFSISSIFYLFPLLDVILCIYYFILAPLIYFKKTDTW